MNVFALAMVLKCLQASKYSAMTGENDDDLEEESLLETPLDHVEPYGLLKGGLMSKLG